MRREFPGRVKAEAFKRSRGRCEICSAKLFPGNIEFDHCIPDQLGGEPTLENCVVTCRACHQPKTKDDIRRIAKAKRLESRHIGARAPSRHALPGSRRSPWKKKISGQVVRRNSSQ